MDAAQEKTREFHLSHISLPARREDAHKGDFGRVVIAAGSVGFTGAPTLAARAAVRCGAGLVFLFVPREIYGIEAVKNDEAMVIPLSESLPEALSRLLPSVASADAVVIGPGLGLSPFARELVYAVLESAACPVVADADAITAIGKRPEILKRRAGPLILTPHEGEFTRLSHGLERLPREEAAREYAVENGVTVVLKGHRTVTALPDGQVTVNTTGNPGMAKGGSGDVLSGMIGALVAQGIPNAVETAVCLHGAAGDSCAEKYGQYAMTPSDMIDELRTVLKMPEAFSGGK